MIRFAVNLSRPRIDCSSLCWAVFTFTAADALPTTVANASPIARMRTTGLLLRRWHVGQTRGNAHPFARLLARGSARPTSERANVRLRREIPCSGKKGRGQEAKPDGYRLLSRRGPQAIAERGIHLHAVLDDP